MAEGGIDILLYKIFGILKSAQGYFCSQLGTLIGHLYCGTPCMHASNPLFLELKVPRPEVPKCTNLAQDQRICGIILGMQALGIHELRPQELQYHAQYYKIDTVEQQ